MSLDIGRIIGHLSEPWLFVGIGVISAILLFVPIEVSSQLGVAALVEQYRGWIGGAFIVSVGLIATQLALGFSRNIKRKWEENTTLKVLRAHLHDLSPEEKNLLSGYIREDKKTQYFDVTDGISQGLAAQGIIFRSSNIGSGYGGFPFNIQPWAWKYLKEHPELLTVADEES